MMTKTERISELTKALMALQLPAMASSLEELFRSADFDAIDRVDLLERIIEPEFEERSSMKFRNRLKRAHLLGGPQTMDKCIDSEARSYLPSGITKTLSSMDFVNDGRNLCILGPSDSGKSYLAKALGINACLHYRTSYHHCEEFLESLVALKQNDYIRYQKKVRFYIKLDLLILDDFLLHTISDERELKVLFEILEKRTELSRSTIVCSQREPNSWASMILNDEVSANAILKRATKHYTVVIKPQN